MSARGSLSVSRIAGEEALVERHNCFDDALVLTFLEGTEASEHGHGHGRVGYDTIIADSLTAL